MSVDDLVEEGEAFRVNFPAASARGVRAHLTNLFDRDREDVRGRRGSPDDAEGCLGAVLLIPVFAFVVYLRHLYHRRQVGKAMAVLFPKGRR